MSRNKKWRPEWTFFIGDNGGRQYNHTCRKCTHGCKQRFRRCEIACSHYSSKRSNSVQKKVQKPQNKPLYPQFQRVPL